MNRKSSINCLKKLYVLLNDVMGDTVLGTKYKRSLKKGIKSLEKNALEVNNGVFKVQVTNNVDNITIDVLSNEDEIIDTIRYDCDAFLNDEIIGKS
tara:strand:+ start:8932 stop:9219 length:288 start_codon:yes stop_codon:yes gene_type:complete